MRDFRTVLFSLATVTLVGWVVPGCIASSSSTSTSTDDINNDDDGDDNSNDDDDDSIPGTPFSISGQAAAKADDVAAAQGKPMFGPNAYRAYTRDEALDFPTSADTVVNDAEVSLVKIFPDKSEEVVDIGTVTTDVNGNFTIDNVEVPVTGSGEPTDFYYEVRVTEGVLEIKAPCAPEGDATINISPETTVAADTLNKVVDIGSDFVPIPDASFIEASRETISADLTEMALDGAVTLPSTQSLEDDNTNMIAMANGSVTVNNNSEKIFKAYQYSAELMALQSNVDATNEQASSYLKRLISDGCNHANGNYIPSSVADAMGAQLLLGSTFTPEALITAYNTHHGESPELNVNTVITNLSTALAEAKLRFTDLEPIESELQIVLYAMQNVDPETFAADTALHAHEALAFLQAAANQTCGFGQGNMPHIEGVIGTLLSNDDLLEPHISNVEIYADSGFGCNSGEGEGHFRANIQLYAAGLDSESVYIESSDFDALDGGSTFLDEGPNNSFSINADGLCVSNGDEVTYTITAYFEGDVTAVKTVTRNHPAVPESMSNMFDEEDNEFINISGNGASPTATPLTRPLFSWMAPDEVLAEIEDAPANSRVVYTYEFSHVDITDDPIGPLGQCASVSAGAQFYEVNNFIPTVDCDKAACATAASVDTENVACRVNIQTFLVDDQNTILGQAAGNFRFFCVDTDDDGNCD